MKPAAPVTNIVIVSPLALIGAGLPEALVQINRHAALKDPFPVERKHGSSPKCWTLDAIFPYVTHPLGAQK
jgi:hypothetical protein